VLTDASPPLSPAQHSAAPFLQIKRVVKQFDEVYAVDDLSLEIAQGEIFGLLGSSGCGKSTLLRLLAGFELPTSGQILLAGQDIGALAPYKRPINMMFQSYALFPHLNVWDNIAFGLRRERLPKVDIVARVEQLLELVQLKPYVKRKPHQLSGGQQQRVALARSLAKRPQLLLLDEPLAALDAKLRKKTQLELVDIIEQVGVTCIMVTHDQEEAMTMATRIGVMNEGKLLQIGRPSDIYETPNCRFVADFIGSVNLFEGTLEVDQPHVLITTPKCRHYVSHGITGTLGMALSVAVRLEKMMIQPQPPRDEERESLEQVGFNLVHGVIKDIAYLGNLTTYHVQLDGSITIVRVTHLNDARYEATQLTWGDPVCVWWDGSNVVVLTH
jgi:putrescine transport system ATP-binding protein